MDSPVGMRVTGQPGDPRMNMWVTQVWVCLQLLPNSCVLVSLLSQTICNYYIGIFKIDPLLTNAENDLFHSVNAFLPLRSASHAN